MPEDRAASSLDLRMFEVLLDRAPDPVFVAREDGRFLFVNQAGCELLGLSLDELLTKNAWDVDKNLSRDVWDWQLAQVGEGLERIQSRAEAPGGEPIDVELAVRVLNLDEGRVVVGFARDMTARQRAQAKVLESRERYRLLADAAFEGIAITDEGIVVDANEALGIMLQVPVSELMGRKIMEFVAPGSVPLVMEHVRSGFEGAYEHLALRSGGEVFPVEVRGKMLAAGKRSLRVTAIRDLTEKKRIEADRMEKEAALRKSEALFRSIVEDQTEFIVRWKPDGTRTFVNKSYCRYFGMTREEAIGTSFFPLIKGEDRAAVEARLAALSPARPVIVGEHRVNLPDGKTGWNRWSDRGFFDENGELYELQSVGMDITELREAQEAAEQHWRQIAEADKMIVLGTLVSGVAHEVNNPNQFIMLSMPTVRRVWKEILPILEDHTAAHPGFRVANVPLSDMTGEITELLGEIEKGSVRIQSIVSQLREYVLEQNPRTREVDVNRVVASAVSLLAGPIRKATGRFSVDYGDALPRVLGNEIRLEQVVVNLLQNACQALRDRKSAIQVTTVYDSRKSRVEIRVEDQGVGISEENLPRLKDPLFTTKRAQGGTGLGLAVSSKIAEDLGAELRFESRLGEGTTATLSIPAAPGAPSA